MKKKPSKATPIFTIRIGFCNCGHFLSIHGPRGCKARFCDCKVKGK